MSHQRLGSANRGDAGWDSGQLRGERAQLGERRAIQIRRCDVGDRHESGRQFRASVVAGALDHLDKRRSERCWKGQRGQPGAGRGRPDHPILERERGPGEKSHRKSRNDVRSESRLARAAEWGAARERGYRAKTECRGRERVGRNE
jgi:hypothetical protein